MKKKKRILISFTISFLTTLTILINQLFIVVADTNKLTSINNSDTQNFTGNMTETSSYIAYQEKYKSIETPDSNVDINITNFSCSADYAKIVHDISNKQGDAVQTDDIGFIEWKINVVETGLYNIGINYFPQAGKGSTIIRTLKIDGQIPFDEASNLQFTRAFSNSGEIENDMFGNEIRPSQVENPVWMSVNLSDPLGYCTKPFKFYFTKGLHTIIFESVRETMIIGAIKIYQVPIQQTYAQLVQEYNKQSYKETNDQFIKIEGEQAELKSDNTIYPITDNSSSTTSPSSYSKLLLNTIGGQKWQNNGQWLEWSFNVTKTGLYKIGIKARQNISSSQSSYRRIYIDGKVPCNELDAVKFIYDTQWQMITLGGNENPNLFYLNEGLHSIKMEVTLGDLSSIAQKISTLVSNLNNTYLDILMVTGPTPDNNRDYMFEKVIPNTLTDLHNESVNLKKISQELISINGMSGSQAQMIENLAVQVEQMSSNPEKIPKLISDFVTNVSSFGSLVSTIRQQPLEIDFISISSKNVNLPKISLGFFNDLWFSFNQFIASFYIDYANIGSTDKSSSAIKVWISSGRDQANALNQLIRNYFTSQSGIKVNLQLVPPGTLLSATLANKGPDIALSNAQSDPLNYAIRGAVADLSQFEGFNEVAKRFQPSALEPLTFNNHVYGIPETQGFPLLFYRSDILSKLELSVPQTWDDVIAMLPILQKRHLTFGMPLPYASNMVGVGINTYAMFLYQNGGQFYKNGGISSDLDSDQAVDAFFKWTNFYNDYQLPTQYDFISRFRNGEIPIGIADYSVYNQLSVFAPELNGIWKFSLLPGTKNADGIIDRTAVSSVTATIMMQDSINKNDGWEFIKWWSSSDTQERYGTELESIMGVAGRYQPANIETLYQIPWNSKDFELLMQQWKWTKGIPEVPGSYMTPRYLDFAFKQAYSGTAGANLEDPGEVMKNASLLINGELSDKRREFGLP